MNPSRCVQDGWAQLLQCASRPDEARGRLLPGRHGVTWQAPLGPLSAPEHTRAAKTGDGVTMYRPLSPAASRSCPHQATCRRLAFQRQVWMNPRREAHAVAGVSIFVASTFHGTPPWGMIAMLAAPGYAGVVEKFSEFRSIIVRIPLNADMK